jgi:predicted Zn-dependent peptidase
MDITQGKLIYGITVNCNSLQDQYSAIVYNAILGGGANSKLFQNVREKASLAYTAGSSYLRQKNNIFIRLRNRNKKL